MTAILFEQVGHTTNGPEAGQFMLVRNDQERTGGFLVFQSSAPDVFSAPKMFDSWVERSSDLDAFFGGSWLDRGVAAAIGRAPARFVIPIEVEQAILSSLPSIMATLHCCGAA